MDLEDAANLALRSPLKAVNGAVNFAEYLYVRRQYSRALKLLVGCVVKNIENMHELNDVIENFSEDIKVGNWRLVVGKTKTAKRNVDRYLKYLPSIAPIVVGAHFEVFYRIEEFFCVQRKSYNKILENSDRQEIDLDNMLMGLRICQKAIRKSEKKYFGKNFDMLKEIEQMGQFRVAIQNPTKPNNP